MIAYIRGILSEKEPTHVVLEAAGVGYELFVPLSTYDRLPRAGEEVKLLARHVVREDDETLYGFATEAERDLFALLTSVSGVGPRIAVAILSGASAGELARTIAGRDVKRLSSIRGVGKKTAEKICIDLKDKVSAYAVSGAGTASGSPVVSDALMALRALGFNEETSAKMVADVLATHPDLADAESVIRAALAGNRK